MSADKEQTAETSKNMKNKYFDIFLQNLDSDGKESYTPDSKEEEKFQYAPKHIYIKGKNISYLR